MNPIDCQIPSPDNRLDTSEFVALNHDVLQSITAFLDLASGFTIAFAECNFWQDGEILIAAIVDILVNDPELEPMQLEVWEFNEPELNLLQELEKRLASLPRQNDKKLVLVLRGLENAIEVVGDYPQFLVDLNFVRDAYARIVPHPVVFVLPDYALTRVANFAPDFWVWKSGVFKFKTSKETMNFAEAKTIDSNRILGNYLKPEKQERIDLLHRLLMEANPSISDLESNRNAASQMNILIQLGSAYFSLSEFNRAIELYDQALSLARKLGDRCGEANSLIGLGYAYNSLEQYQQAIQFHQQSLNIFRTIDDQQGQASNLNSLGNAYSSLGQYQKAIQFYQQALEISKAIADLHGEAMSINNLGIAYYSLRQHLQSTHFYQQSLKIFREIEDLQGESFSLRCLGISYNRLGQYQKSISLYSKALKISREIGDRASELDSLVCLGNSYDWIGSYQQSILFYEQALKISRKIGKPHSEYVVLNYLGRVLKKAGRRNESLEVLKASKQMNEELDKAIAPLETEAKEPKRFIIKDEPEEMPDWLKKSMPDPNPVPRKRTRHKNIFQSIANWLRGIWSKLWRIN